MVVKIKLFYKNIKYKGGMWVSILKVKSNWDSYMDRVNSWRIGVFNQELSSYMLDEGSLGRLSYEEIETLSNQNAMRLFKKLKWHQ